METLVKRAGNVYKIVCVIILALMVLIVFTNTTLRYCFSSGIAPAEEILRYLFIWMSFLGIMAVYKENEHISVTIVTERLSPKAGALTAIFANLLAVFAFAVLLWGSGLYLAESASTVGQLTGLPYRLIIAAILLAAAMCCLFALRDLSRAWKRFANAGKGE